MTIKYLNHSITEVTHVDTKEIFYELSHWYVSSDSPEIAGRKHSGYFKTHREAEDHHNQMLVDGLLKE